MNGVGADTTVKAVELGLVVILRVVSILTIVIHAAAVVMWIIGKIKWKKSEEYKKYKALIAEQKKA
jgi:hypothetical protein